MAHAAIALQVVGTIVSMAGHLQRGKAAEAARNFEAQQIEEKAKLKDALAQREAIEERRKKRILISNAIARAGASGGGVYGDGSVMKTIEGIEATGEQNALTALWEGRQESFFLRNQANALRFEGKQARKAGRIGALSSVLSGGASIAKTYNDTYGKEETEEEYA